MRRNLVGKMLPQQFKIRWEQDHNDTIDSTEAAKAARLLAYTCTNENIDNDLFQYYAVPMQNFFLGSPKFKKEDFIAIALGYQTQRTYTKTEPLTTSPSLSAGQGTRDRVRGQMRPIPGAYTVGNLLGPFYTASNSGTITTDQPNGNGGLCIVMEWDGTGTAPQIGMVNYQPLPNFGNGPENIDYWQLRFRFSEIAFDDPYALEALDVYMEGTPADTLFNENSGQDYVYQGRARASGASMYFTMAGPGRVKLDYAYVDMRPSNASGGELTTSDTRLAGFNLSYAQVAVRASNGEVARRNLTEFRTGGVFSNNSFGAFSDGLATGQPHTRNTVDMGSAIGMSSVEHLWNRLYVTNNNLPEEVDENAEWFILFPLFRDDRPEGDGWENILFTTSAQAELVDPSIHPADLWAAENRIHLHVHAAAISGADRFDEDWFRERTQRAESHRTPGQQGNESFTHGNSYDKDFTPEDYIRGANKFTAGQPAEILMGVSVLSETGDRADGFDPDTGTASSRASETGWIPGNNLRNGRFYYDFGWGDAGGEATSSDSVDVGSSFTAYANTAQSCERSIRTYIKEDLSRNVDDNTFNYRKTPNLTGNTFAVTLGQYGAVS